MATTGWQRRGACEMVLVCARTRRARCRGQECPRSYDSANRMSQVAIPNGTHTEYEYAYPPSANLRHGDNMLTKVAPWVDDFQDGNITGWSGDTGDYSVASGVMENTLHASLWREIYLSESDADVDLRFDYIRYSSTGTSQAYLRYTDASNSVYVEFLPTVIRLRQRDGGVLTTLDSISTTVAEDTWYTVRAVADGGEVTVYWGEKGGDSTEILSTASATVTSTSTAAYFRAGPNSEHGWDNVQVIAGSLGTTTTFTHNDANELTSTTTNGVTTDYEYDEWGRLIEKDDGTHTATYAYRYGSKLYSVTSDFPGEGNVTYETGGDGKRRSRVAGASETWYNWSAAWTVLSEEDEADGSSGSLSRTYVGRNTAHVNGISPGTGDCRYYTGDHLVSTRGVWSEDKSSYAKLEYTPYGESYVSSGSSGAITCRFTGHEWDSATGLYISPYRHYSPAQTNWTSRDPIGTLDGPNLYAYVGRNPVMRRDPLGLLWAPIDPDWWIPGKLDVDENCSNLGGHTYVPERGNPTPVPIPPGGGGTIYVDAICGPSGCIKVPGGTRCTISCGPNGKPNCTSCQTIRLNDWLGQTPGPWGNNPVPPKKGCGGCPGGSSGGVGSTGQR